MTKTPTSSISKLLKCNDNNLQSKSIPHAIYSFKSLGRMSADANYVKIYLVDANNSQSE